MDPLLVLMGIALVAGTVFVALQYRRRAAPPIADDPRDAWELPGANATSQPNAPSPSDTATPQFLDRDMLLNPERTLDPSAWDALPASDPDPNSGEDALPARPQYLDRSMFERDASQG